MVLLQVVQHHTMVLLLAVLQLLQVVLHHTMVLLLAVLQQLQVVQHQTTREGLADRASRA